MLAILLLPLLATLASASPIKRYPGVQISAGRDGKCLSVASGATPSDGLAVLSASCSGASTWDINPGSGSVVLHGTGFALDAGSNPGNNGALKVRCMQVVDETAADREVRFGPRTLDFTNKRSLPQSNSMGGN